MAVLFGLSLTMNVSAQIPAATLKTIDGKTVRTDTIGTHGKPVIVDFFATWCKPCIRELNAIAEVYEDWKKETGCEFVAISIDQAQNTHKVAPLVSENSWPWETVLLDPNGELKRAFGIQMIPYTLIIDGNGKIIYKHNGYTDGAEEELIETIRNIKK